MLNRISSEIRSLPTDQKEKIQAAISRHYEDYPYLGSQVTAKLTPSQKEAVLGSVKVIEFKQSEFAASAYATRQLEITPVEKSLDSRQSRSNDPTARPSKHRASQPLTQPAVSPVYSRTRATETLSPKEAYLHGIRTTAMLGDPELQPLANLIQRPIVVVREEHGNNVEKIVFPATGGRHIQDAVVVQNSRNAHFKTFVPKRGQNIVTGHCLSGEAREGDYSGAGTNDCLIASIKGSGGNFRRHSNAEIREYCASYQEIHISDSLYIPDRGAAPDRHNLFTSEADISANFTGHAIIKPNEDTIAQGVFHKGPVGEWTILNPNGLFKVNYDATTHHPICIEQEGTLGPDGKIAPLGYSILHDTTAENLQLIAVR
jgi:hypothetical protein